MRSGAVKNRAGNVLYVNASDERGVLLAAHGGAFDRPAIRMWGQLMKTLRPTVALDIGANYGEVAFSLRYRGLRELHLVEPNPAVLRHLSRTVHVAQTRSESGSAVILHAGAASDATGTARLHFHGESSGLSSLSQPSDRWTSVDCFRMDDRVRLTPDDVLLFKIDVEGHEHAVLRGMSNLLAHRRFAGLCELVHADDECLDYLCRQFDVCVIRKSRETLVDLQTLRSVIARERDRGWTGVNRDVIIYPRGTA
jgi:FkbM family methyltransferase